MTAILEESEEDSMQSSYDNYYASPNRDRKQDHLDHQTDEDPAKENFEFGLDHALRRPPPINCNISI